METKADRLPPPAASFKSSSLPADKSSDLDLYTIPSHSCWFSWDSIHDTERIELREFFDGSSFTRTPKIYKEYRDFIISKFREDPSRRLTFTEVRKSLVGDVCILRKVFNFLDKWGLINFGAPPPPADPTEEVGVEEVRVEEGAPIGVRVVGAPNSLKPLMVPPLMSDASGGGGGVEGVDIGFKLPPLASYSDVYGHLSGEKGLICGNCKEKCDSKYHECIKEKFIICLKCFEKGAYGENKSVGDFKLNETTERSVNQGVAWTETETLLLLESVLKHGDDWELVAQNVQNKTKLECISRLIELPFGELMLGSHGKFSSKSIVDEHDAAGEQRASSEPHEKQKASSESQENSKVDNHHLEQQKASSESQENSKVDNYHLEQQKASSESQENSKVDNHQCEEQKASSESQENSKVDNHHHEEQKASSESEEKSKVDNHHHEEQKASSESQENSKVDNHHQDNNHHRDIIERENAVEIEDLEPPPKKSRIDSSDPSRSLIEQVALISTMVGPEITVAAANASVSVLSDGNPLVKEIFYSDDPTSTDERRSGNLDMEMEREIQSEDSEMKDASHSSEVVKIPTFGDSIPLALRTRAAVGTALGAAAAHARLLADQEEREIENLMAFIIEVQLKKLQCKVKHFEDLEHIMEKEHALLEKSKDEVIAQRMETLQRIFGAGISQLRDHNSLKLQSSGV